MTNTQLLYFVIGVMIGPPLYYLARETPYEWRRWKARRAQKLQQQRDEDPAEIERRIAAWCSREHDVFRDGAPIGRTTITPITEAAVRRYQISAYINTGATEPRWEAWSGLCPSGSFGGDPNQVVAACVAKIERAAG